MYKQRCPHKTRYHSFVPQCVSHSLLIHHLLSLHSHVPLLPAPSLSYPLLHRDLVVVADRVLSQEVKLHHVLLVVHLGVQFDVLHPQRAAADRVRGLTFLLFVTRPQCKLRGEHNISSLSLKLKSVTFAEELFSEFG